jgi:hypothetical protein
MIAPIRYTNQGDLYYMRSSRHGSPTYFILTKPLDEDDGEWLAWEFHFSMEAFGGLPGIEYSPIEVRFHPGGRLANYIDARKMSDKEIEQLDGESELIKLASRVIAEHGENWNQKEHWIGTGFWKD